MRTRDESWTGRGGLDNQLIGLVRYRVRYQDQLDGDGQPTGRIKSDVVLDHQRPKCFVSKKLGGVRLWSWTSQQDSTINLLEDLFLVEVVVEQNDRRYGEWHQVGTWEPQQEVDNG